MLELIANNADITVGENILEDSENVEVNMTSHKVLTWLNGSIQIRSRKVWHDGHFTVLDDLNLSIAKTNRKKGHEKHKQG